MCKKRISYYIVILVIAANVLFKTGQTGIYAGGIESASGNEVSENAETGSEEHADAPSGEDTADADTPAEDPEETDSDESVSADTVSGNVSENGTETSKEDPEEGNTEEVSANDIKEGEIPVDIIRPDVISMELPLAEENKAVFDFILDPDQLINATGAVKYGGKKFQENATVFFENKKEGAESEYSDTSDPLEIINKSTVSVNLTATLTLADTEDVSIKDRPEFTEEDGPSIWFELTDSEGNVTVLDGKGNAVLNHLIDAAPAESYTYTYNDESGEYEPEDHTEEIQMPCYSFSVKGACGGSGWKKSGLVPKLKVTWTVDPVTEETDAEESAGEEPSGEGEKTE